MKIIIFILSFFFLLHSSLFSGVGVVLNYKIRGQGLGQAQVRGKFRAVFEPRIKRITGAIYYQEAGAVFPELDEKDLIVDYNQKMKFYYTKESRDWLTTPLSSELSLIKPSQVSVRSSKNKNKLKIIVNLNLPTRLGGRQKYIITFIYNEKKPDKVYNELKGYGQPNISDILSIFIHNERIVNQIYHKSAIKKYGIPDSFHVVWKQKSKIKLDVTGTLKTKSISRLPADAYETR